MKWSWWPIGILMLLMLGCAATPCKSPYQVIVPTLEAAPVPLACQQGLTTTRCLLLLEEDYRKVVRELKAACRAVGGDTESCQTQARSINNLSVDK